MLQQTNVQVLEPALPDPEASADAASLNYVSDAEPGIRRRKAGTGFSYASSTGRRIDSRATLDRIRKLAIPPAWTEVWISPDPNGHIQATGRDLRDRKQYRYHERWSACRDEAKYSSLVAFAEALPKLRARIEVDLRKHSLTRERVVASVIWLLDNTMIRIGNATYARDNQSFGLTTLRQRHVDLHGNKVRFTFKGKSGRQWNLGLTDRRIVRIVRQAQELPGQHLFQYVDDDGERRTVQSQDVNAYMREAMGADFGSKHFRTWGGTKTAAGLFTDTPLPETKRETKIVLNGLIDQVADRLGNTRSVCRRCYVHPAIIDSWLGGTLQDEMKAARKGLPKTPDGLDAEEALVLAWLKKREAA